VASVAASHELLVARLRSLTGGNTLHVSQLGPALAVNILTSWLSQAGRTVTPEQLHIIYAALNKYMLIGVSTYKSLDVYIS